MSANEKALALSVSQNQGLERSSVNLSEIERLVLVVGGGALSAYGLTRRSPLGFLLAGFGVGLLYRGATDHCEVYESLGVNTARHSEVARQVHVAKAVTINRSPQELSHSENLADRKATTETTAGKLVEPKAASQMA